MNYYDILEVSPSASKEVIRAAYKSLMQRYHPDKNPDDAAAASRASWVVQAYGVLSDVEGRAAYDNTLSAPSQKKSPSATPQSPHTIQRPQTHARSTKSAWYIGLLLTVILISSVMIFSFSKKNKSPLTELIEIRSLFGKENTSEQQKKILYQRQEAILSSHPDINKEEINARSNALRARTFELFNSPLTVSLQRPVALPENNPEPLERADHNITLPVVQLRVGTFDADKVLQHLDRQKADIKEQLAQRLALAKYEALTKVDGEKYVKDFILDALGEMMGTHRFEDYPSSLTESPGRYGVIDVVLPESFSVTSSNSPSAAQP